MEAVGAVMLSLARMDHCTAPSAVCNWIYIH